MSAAWLAAPALALAACAAPEPAIDLMPPPAAYEEVPVPFGQAEAQIGDSRLRDMLFVTSRAPAGSDEADSAYSEERGYLLRAGSARIGFGDADVTWEEARRISLLKNRPGEFPLRVEAVEEYGIIPDSVSDFTPPALAGEAAGAPPERFLRDIEDRLAASDSRDIFIYVHGFKVVFENPLLVASEMWHFLGYDGAFIAFSWPSTPSRLAYFKDAETARVSAWGLRKLIEYLARETSAERIHVLGYSAGTRLVLTALHDLALIHDEASDESIRGATKLGNVLIVGSDVDTGLFASYVLDGMLRVPERLTLYSSPADKALKASETVLFHRRLGEVVTGTLDERMRDFVRREPRVSFVDVSGAPEFDAGKGHGYFRGSPWVSSDVLITLRYGLSPAERGLVQGPGSPVWNFPPDYPERFRQALEEAADSPAP